MSLVFNGISFIVSVLAVIAGEPLPLGYIPGCAAPGQMTTQPGDDQPNNRIEPMR